MSSTTKFGEQPVTFQLNDKSYVVCPTAPGDLSLNTYIREYARLKGTKFMCREGGCGSCIVTLEFTHPATGERRVVSVNSCMFPVHACHGLKVTTTEGIGSKQKGYHEIQTRLTQFYGTQCGYCTPGWVMSMYSLLEANPKATMKEIEDSFSGNLCRCTGYRPILDAFKSFASDKSKELERKVEDIEDLLKVCKRSGVACHGKCGLDKSKRGLFDCVEMNKKDDCDIEFVEVALANPSLRLQFQDGSKWFRVTSVDEIFEIFDMINGTYMLVGGNTAQGILKDRPPPEVFIDINGVGFLKAHSFHSNNLHVGANMTLNDTIRLFLAVSDENPRYFSYLRELAKHIEKVANTPVRNVGTIAGNLTIKHVWRRFQSDIFLILETVGAVLSIRGESEDISTVSLLEFLDTNMYKKVILQIILPPLESSSYVVRTFKIMPRAQNALAYVNAGFRFKVNRKDRYKVVDRPNIILGNISSSFTHAYQTESFLVNKHLLDEATLQGALNTLGYEVKPDCKLPEPKPEFRRRLTQALFYRVVLGLDPESVNPKYRSGGENISRPLSHGQQEYDSNISLPPLYQPLPKLESLIQCSGEAQYIYDIPRTEDDLYAALVITKQGPGTLECLDPSIALKVPGVVAFFSEKDIPGENSCTQIQVPFIPEKEKAFADKEVLYAGQAVGVIVAQTQELADRAAELVIIKITDKKKPALDVREIAKEKDPARLFLAFEKEAVPKPSVQRVVKGEWKIGSQYHFTMETLVCYVVPVEDGILDVYCSSHWLQLAHEAISAFLLIPEHRINMVLRQVGGSYGMKLSRPNLVGCAVSLAAHLLNKPVRMVMKLETLMEGIGKRYPCYFDYEAGVNDEGEIQYLDTHIYEDNGISFNDPVSPTCAESFTNVYEPSTWGTKLYNVKSDKTSNVWMRAPGTLEGISVAEHILEHVAHEVKKDPLTVRERNLNPVYPISDLITRVKEKSEYDSRKADVEKFNLENVWKKRSISLVPMRHSLATPANWHAMVSIFRNDGTVAVVHGGVEIGQGVNTKAAQVCAATLGIPLEWVQVKPTSNMICPNDTGTGNSVTSEGIVRAVERCCQILNARLDPIRNQLVAPTWQALIQAAYMAMVDLNATYMFTGLPGRDFVIYDVFGATVLEVEVDILTGEHKINRVDILEDAGKSFNPFVDIGQIEGAFVQGLGYYTHEEIIYHADTGRCLTNRTLHYEIPGAKDIPIDFRTYILKNSVNPLGILGSKGTGEPAISMAISVTFAIRQALRSARLDVGLPDTWLEMDSPFTGERIQLGSGIDAKHYLL